MYNYKKGVVILAAVMVLLFVGQVMAQTSALDKFKLGKSTYDQVKANLPSEAIIIGGNKEMPKHIAYPRYSIMTNGSGYGIEGLAFVDYSFDKHQKLMEVELCLKGKLYGDIKQYLSSRYQLYKETDRSIMYKETTGDFVTLYGIEQGDNTVTYKARALVSKIELEDKKWKIYVDMHVDNVKTAAGILRVEHNPVRSGPDDFKSDCRDRLKLNGKTIYENRDKYVYYISLQNKVLHFCNFEVVLLFQNRGPRSTETTQLVQVNQDGWTHVTEQPDLYFGNAKLEQRGNKLILKNVDRDDSLHGGGKLETWVYEHGKLRPLKVVEVAEQTARGQRKP